MSEKNGGAWWEGFILQGLIEFLNGFGFCVTVKSNRFPEGNTILWHLLWILATRQRQDRCYLCEFLKGAYQYIGEIVIGNMTYIILSSNYDYHIQEQNHNLRWIPS